MELNPPKRRKKNKGEDHVESHETIQYDPAISYLQEKIFFLDAEEEPTIVQKLFSLYKFQKEQNILCLPLKNQQAEVSVD